MYQKILHFKIPHRSTIDITDAVSDVVQLSNVRVGLCHLFVRHTSASLIINENDDPDVRMDLERFMSQLVPDGHALYRHVTEGEDDMSGHIRTMLTHTELSIPIGHHKLLLGQWQGIYLWEHRRKGYTRSVVVTVTGEAGKKKTAAVHTE